MSVKRSTSSPETDSGRAFHPPCSMGKDVTSTPTGGTPAPLRQEGDVIGRALNMPFCETNPLCFLSIIDGVVCSRVCKWVRFRKTNPFWSAVAPRYGAIAADNSGFAAGVQRAACRLTPLRPTRRGGGKRAGRPFYARTEDTGGTPARLPVEGDPPSPRLRRTSPSSPRPRRDREDLETCVSAKRTGFFSAGKQGISC